MWLEIHVPVNTCTQIPQPFTYKSATFSAVPTPFSLDLKTKLFWIDKTVIPYPFYSMSCVQEIVWSLYSEDISFVYGLLKLYCLWSPQIDHSSQSIDLSPNSMVIFT